MTTPNKGAELSVLVHALPEIYQSIYGHPEFAVAAARGCEDRLSHFVTVHDHLRDALGRPLRVLDLGCAQGYFSLALAARGASVIGVDFAVENVNLCRALASEHRALNATFLHATVEEVIGSLQPGAIDLVLGLSVFHHLVHAHGIDAVRTILAHLAERVSVGIFEMALREEPLYWGPSQPVDPRELLTGWSEMYSTTHFTTHLSKIARPMILARGRADAATFWESLSATAVHDRVLFSIPSAQQTSVDRDRFHALVSDKETARLCAESERAGGVAPTLRVFLEAQMEPADLLLDLAPGAGFVSLSAATMTPAPTVVAIVANAGQRQDLECAARAATATISVYDASASTIDVVHAQVHAQIHAHGVRGGRVFVHSDHQSVAHWAAVLTDVVNDGHVVAWCVGGMALTSVRRAAADELQALHFVLQTLSESHGELVLVAAEPAVDELIAVHQSARVSEPDLQAGAPVELDRARND